MAKAEPRRSTHVIDAVPSQGSTCHSCGQPIATGELRLSEAFVGDDPGSDVSTRFHHLDCAARHQPYKLRSALAAHTAPLPERGELEAAITRALSAVDPAEDDEVTRDDYQRFIAQLRAEPDDDFLLVFGDWLQRANDPRGELVAVQHALETATAEARPKLAFAERKLLAVYRRQFMPERREDTCQWRRGFVHRLEIKLSGPISLAHALAPPSFRLLRELAVSYHGYEALTITEHLHGLPATLRVLELGVTYNGSIGPLGALFAAGLPQLRRLRLTSEAELGDLCHPGLGELELVCTTGSFAVRPSQLDRSQLPGLVRLDLTVEGGLDAALAELVATALFGRLTTLGLHGDLTPTGAAALVRALEQRSRLATLDLRGVRIADAALAVLGQLATTIVHEQPAPAPRSSAASGGLWLVRHRHRPEWGIGRVLSDRTRDFLAVKFERAGVQRVAKFELLEVRGAHVVDGPNRT